MTILLIISAFALSRRGNEARDACGREVIAESWHSISALYEVCVGASTQTGVLIPNHPVLCHMLIGSTFQITSLYFMSCQV